MFSVLGREERDWSLSACGFKEESGIIRNRILDQVLGPGVKCSLWPSDELVFSLYLAQGVSASALLKFGAG